MSSNSFDEKAATWDDDPAKVERARVVAEAIREAIPLDRTTRMLEYGAGTGLVSQALRDAVGPITMVDTSAGMRAVMEGKVADGTIAGARVWDLDLSTGAVEGIDERFDLVVTVLALHHIPEVGPALANFAHLLSGRGHLAIADLDEEDGTFHPEGFDGHHGFDHASLAAQLERAGFVDVTFRPCHHILRDGRAYTMFLATASRGGTD